MKRTLFKRFCEIAKTGTGISLGDGKEALVEARVRKRMRQLGMEKPADYMEYLKSDETGNELTQFLDAISTNVTSFFREPYHFHALRELISERIKKGSREITIWSAACSTGEEPYTIAMIAADTINKASVKVRILATDISTKVLSIARLGQYSDTKISNIEPSLRKQYFNRVLNDKGETVYEVSEEIRNMITFGQLNLSRPPFPMKGPFDAVFCRNVMIYFDQETRKTLLLEISRLLAHDSLLFIGHSESLAGCDVPYSPLGNAIYIKNDLQLNRKNLGSSRKSKIAEAAG